MRRRAAWMVAIAVVAIAVGVLLIVGVKKEKGVRRQASGVGSESEVLAGAEVGSSGRAARDAKWPLPVLPAKTVTIAGHVFDEVDRAPVGAAEVVVRGLAGESTTATRPDGAFAIEVAPGAYHVAVRGGGVITAGVPDRDWLDHGPNAAVIGLPDDALMPVVDARQPVTNLELVVPRDATITGTVSDRDGKRIAHAVVRARGSTRPAFGSDVAETDDGGSFTLVVAPGKYTLDARAAGYARNLGPVDATAVAHASSRVALVMAKGCEIRGRVLAANGQPAGDGAIERLDNGQFGPAGHIETDGTFHWVTLEQDDVTLRAWPWKSAPTPALTFSCLDGARHADVVLRARDAKADVTGTIVDAAGAPVPFAFLEVSSLEPMLPSQQERADSEGHYEIHDITFGRYQLTASAPGRGIAVTTIASPQEALELRLYGTGRIEGTTTALANGTLEVAFEACFDAIDLARRPMAIAHEPRLVSVQGGRFAIDDAPACDLLFSARWRGQRIQSRVAVAPQQIVHVELAVGPPHEKVVHGVVRDRDANAIANARISAVYEGHRADATSDADGHFTMRSFAGAKLVASDGPRTGTATVGRANVADEQLEVVIEPARR